APGAVDLDVPGDAADDAPAHRGNHAVEERAAHHHQERPPQHHPSDEEVDPALEEVPEGNAEDHSQLAEHQCLPPLTATSPTPTRPTSSRPTICPSASFTSASAWAITRASWVEKMKVVPSRWFSSFIRSTIFSPVTESRLAVGSSARTICGPPTSARATATRCR